jgi:hypothetical protein
MRHRRAVCAKILETPAKFTIAETEPSGQKVWHIHTS